MSDCRFGVSPVNYPDPDPDGMLGIVKLICSKVLKEVYIHRIYNIQGHYKSCSRNIKLY